MRDSSHQHSIRCARRASARAIRLVHRELSRGIPSLRVIACIAPFLGMLGTTVLLVSAVPAEFSCLYNACCAGGLGEAFVPLALSLPVATVAWAAFHPSPSTPHPSLNAFRVIRVHSCLFVAK